MPNVDDGRRNIFDHWDYISPEDYKDEIEDIQGDAYDELTDEQKWQALATIEEWAYEDVKQELSDMIGDNKVLCVGYADLWNRVAAGGFEADDLQDAIDKMHGTDSGEIGWYQAEDGELHMTFTHHDGTNDVAMRTLTTEGCELIYDNEYNYDDPMGEPELHQKLMSDDELTQPLTYFGN